MLYLIVIMAISVFFSAVIYQLSLQELDRGLRRPVAGNFLQFNLTPSQLASAINEIKQERENRYFSAKERVERRLLLVNMIILLGGGILSYLLAKKTLRPIEEAHEAQSRFTADASHELRTPIAAMQTETEVTLMNPKLTLAQAKTQLQSNLEEMAKLTALSEGLLLLARAESGQLPNTKVPIHDAINEAVDRVQPLASKKHIKITAHPVHAAVQGDQSSLTEALVILLENAVKYSPEKTAVVINGKAKNKIVTIRVQDKGIGIKANELTKIFERFYRADAARTESHANGYGLGLAIAKNIVEMHRGTIFAASKPGKGSTFTIKLPAATFS
jgi:signal transduction histidine kinase